MPVFITSEKQEDVERAVNRILSYVGNFQTERTIPLADWVQKRILQSEPDHLNNIMRKYKDIKITLNVTTEVIHVQGFPPENLSKAESDVYLLLGDKLKLSVCPVEIYACDVLALTMNRFELRKKLEKLKVGVELPKEFNLKEPIIQLHKDCTLQIMEHSIMKFGKTQALMNIWVNGFDKPTPFQQDFTKRMNQEVKIKHTPTMFTTLGGKTGFSTIIHVCGIGETIESKLAECIKHTLEYAKANKIESVTIPMTMHAGNVVSVECISRANEAQMVMDTIWTWTQQNQGPYPKHILVGDADSEFILNAKCHFTKLFLPNMHIFHQWFWKTSDMSWVPYTAEDNTFIELAHQYNMTSFALPGTLWNIHLTTMSQENQKTLTRREIKREEGKRVPVNNLIKYSFYKSLLANTNTNLTQKHLLKIRGRPSDTLRAMDTLKTELGLLKVENDRIELPSTYITVETQSKMTSMCHALFIHMVMHPTFLLFKGLKPNMAMFYKTLPDMFAIQYPTHWTNNPQKIYIHTLPAQSDLFCQISARFHDTLKGFTIDCIEQIENKWLWAKYSAQKSFLAQKLNRMDDTEKLLFHGTSKTEPSLIYTSQDGFDPKFANDGLWGRGTYFASNAIYSNDYAYRKGDSYQLFLADVLIGECIQLAQDKTLRMPPVNCLTFFNFCRLNPIKDQKWLGMILWRQ